MAQVVRTLGRGSFARCLLARRKEDGFLYAIKQFLVPFSDLSPREQKEVGRGRGFPRVVAPPHTCWLAILAIETAAPPPPLPTITVAWLPPSCAHDNLRVLLLVGGGRSRAPGKA